MGLGMEWEPEQASMELLISEPLAAADVSFY
jgi:hypothetical protein